MFNRSSSACCLLLFWDISFSADRSRQTRAWTGCKHLCSRMGMCVRAWVRLYSSIWNLFFLLLILIYFLGCQGSPGLCLLIWCQRSAHRRCKITGKFIRSFVCWYRYRCVFVKSQWEHRDEGIVKGHYSVLEPDGSIRSVHYTGKIACKMVFIYLDGNFFK